MSTSNQSGSNEPIQNNEGKKSNAIIYWVIILALLAGCVFLFMSKSQMKEENDTLLKQEAIRTDSIEKERRTLEDEFKAATGKIDELMSEKSKNDSSLNQSKKELGEMQSKIQVVMKKDKVTLEELKHAREMVKDLNDKIKAYEERIAELEKENKELNGKNKVLTAERDTAVQQNVVLKKYGSILYTNNIRLTPEHKKKDGTDKETK